MRAFKLRSTLYGPAGVALAVALALALVALMLLGAGTGRTPVGTGSPAPAAIAINPSPGPGPAGSAAGPLIPPPVIPSPVATTATKAAAIAEAGASLGRPRPATSPSPASSPSSSAGLLFDSNRTGNYEIYRANLDGSGVTQLTTGTSYDSFWPKVSPNASQILFYRTPAGVHDLDYTKASLWMMSASGANVHQVLAVGAYSWGFQAHAEWSPDGTRLVMIGGPMGNQQIYITAADGTNPVRLTSDGNGGLRPGINIDPSWSPTGASVLFVGCPIALCTPGGQEVYRVAADGTGEQRLTNDSSPDYDPYSSPDGTRIAWLRDTSSLLSSSFGIMMMNADGTNQHSLINDGGINSKPNWYTGSATIYFHRQVPPGTGPPLFNVYRISASGGTPTLVLADDKGAYNNEYPDSY